MPLGIVDPFSPPYEMWDYRHPSVDELMAFYKIHDNFAMPMIKTNLLAQIDNHYDAAVYQVKRGASEIESHINHHLDDDHNFIEWRRRMPSAIPKALWDYQLRHVSGNTYKDVTDIINEVGVYLPEGQYVFHGGKLSGGEREFVTTRPLSTSLCPQIAVRLAEHLYKAHNAGRLELVLLKLKNVNTKAYVFKNKNTNHGHEKEIVFAAGARITLRGSHMVSVKYPVATPSGETKYIPSYVIVGEIS